MRSAPYHHDAIPLQSLSRRALPSPSPLPLPAPQSNISSICNRPQPGTAEFVVSRLGPVGLGCLHGKGHDPERHKRKYPSRLAFFHSAPPLEPAVDEVRISLLKTDKRFCIDCLDVIVPGGVFNSWSIAGGLTDKSDGWLRKAAESGGVRIPLHRLTATPQPLPPYMMHLPDDAEAAEAWGWLLQERRPFYMDQLHLDQGWGTIIERNALDDSVIAQTYGRPYGRPYVATKAAASSTVKPARRARRPAEQPVEQPAMLLLRQLAKQLAKRPVEEPVKQLLRKLAKQLAKDQAGVGRPASKVSMSSALSSTADKPAWGEDSIQAEPRGLARNWGRCEPFPFEGTPRRRHLIAATYSSRGPVSDASHASILALEQFLKPSVTEVPLVPALTQESKRTRRTVSSVSTRAVSPPASSMTKTSNQGGVRVSPPAGSRPRPRPRPRPHTDQESGPTPSVPRSSQSVPSPSTKSRPTAKPSRRMTTTTTTTTTTMTTTAPSNHTTTPSLLKEFNRFVRGDSMPYQHDRPRERGKQRNAAFRWPRGKKKWPKLVAAPKDEPYEERDSGHAAPPVGDKPATEPSRGVHPEDPSAPGNSQGDDGPGQRPKDETGVEAPKVENGNGNQSSQKDKTEAPKYGDLVANATAELGAGGDVAPEQGPVPETQSSPRAGLDDAAASHEQNADVAGKDSASISSSDWGDMADYAVHREDSEDGADRDFGSGSHEDIDEGLGHHQHHHEETQGASDVEEDDQDAHQDAHQDDKSVGSWETDDGLEQNPREILDGDDGDGEIGRGHDDLDDGDEEDDQYDDDDDWTDDDKYDEEYDEDEYDEDEYDDDDDDDDDDDGEYDYGQSDGEDEQLRIDESQDDDDDGDGPEQVVQIQHGHSEDGQGVVDDEEPQADGLKHDDPDVDEESNHHAASSPDDDDGGGGDDGDGDDGDDDSD